MNICKFKRRSSIFKVFLHILVNELHNQLGSEKSYKHFCNIFGMSRNEQVHQQHFIQQAITSCTDPWRFLLVSNSTERLVNFTVTFSIPCPPFSFMHMWMHPAYFHCTTLQKKVMKGYFRKTARILLSHDACPCTHAHTRTNWYTSFYLQPQASPLCTNVLKEQCPAQHSGLYIKIPPV